MNKGIHFQCTTPIWFHDSFITKKDTFGRITYVKLYQESHTIQHDSNHPQ